MLQIVKNNIRLILSSKGGLFITIILPVLLLALSLTVFNPQGGEAKWRIGLVDKDDTILSKDLVSSTESSSILYKDMSEEDNLDSKLLENSLDALLIIPEGFEKSVMDGENPKVSIRVLQGQEIVAMLQNRVNMYINSLLELKEIKNTDDPEKLMLYYNEMQSSGVKYEEKNTGSNASNGLQLGNGFLTYVLSVSMFSIGSLIISERQGGTLNRIKCSPIRSINYIYAMFFTALIILIFNMFTIFIIANFIVPTYIAWPIYLLWLLHGTCWIFFSIFMSLAANTSRFYSGITSSISLIFAMLGGSFWPIWLMPEFLQNIGMITPNYWANTAILSLISGKPISTTTDSFIALIGFIVLGISLCAFSLRRGKNAETFI